ncbi:MAG: tyrosine-type recombinase/integrase [Patescibacteria group bacterium]|nr:tyrosine-type recombinase/integrase [Patescibacteria group bacterium]
MARSAWGTIQSRGNSVWIRYPAAGGRVTETLPRGSRRRDAELLLAKRRLEIEQGTWIRPETTTLGAFLPEWLKLSGAKDNSLRIYGQCVKRLVGLPWLSAITIQKLTINHVERIKRELGGLSPRTLNQTLDVGRQAYSWALDHGLAHSNPFAAVKRLPLGENTKKALEPAQAAALLAELRRTGDPLDSALAFMLLTLRRYSEMAGLRWIDVDFARRQYTVEQVWLAEQAKFRQADGQKNKRATHELRDAALAVLKKQQLTQRTQKYEVEQAGWAWEEHGLVFTADLGGPVPRSSLRKALTYACKRVKVPVVELHELRHTGASILIYAGADQWQLMAAGGWTSLAMVQRNYGHLFKSRTAEALDGLEGLLTRKNA